MINAGPVVLASRRPFPGDDPAAPLGDLGQHVTAVAVPVARDIVGIFFTGSPQVGDILRSSVLREGPGGQRFKVWLMAASLNDAVRRLLDEPNPAVLGTVNPDGSPQTSVVWVGRDGSDL